MERSQDPTGHARALLVSFSGNRTNTHLAGSVLCCIKMTHC